MPRIAIVRGSILSAPCVGAWSGTGGTALIPVFLGIPLAVPRRPGVCDRG